MLKTVLTLVALLGACSSPDLQGIRPIVSLTARHALIVETPVATGSCSPITSTTFLTAAHVVQGMAAENVTVNGQPITAIIYLGELDAALLVTATDHGHAPWPMDVRPLQPAEALSVSGYGAGLFWWSTGLATDSQDRVSVPVAPGDSGCPVLDEHGDIVGIVVARGYLANHHCWIVPATAIADALPDDVLYQLTDPWSAIDPMACD